MSEVIKAIVRRVADVWNNFDLRIIDEIYDPELVANVIGLPEIKGRERYRDFVKQFRAPFPDLRVTADSIIVEGDTAVLRWTVDGTQQGELEFEGQKLRPTGARVHYSGLTQYRLRNGKIFEEMLMGDAITQRRQLGVLPDMAAAAAVERLGKEVIEEFINKGRLELAEHLVVPDYVHHGPQGMVHRGVEGSKQFVTGFRTALPDLHFTIEDQVCTADRIVMRWSVRGTHQGELFGVKPSGRPVMVFGTSITRIENGKYAETWAYFDMLDYLHQLGAAQKVKVEATA